MITVDDRYGRMSLLKFFIEGINRDRIRVEFRRKPTVPFMNHQFGTRYQSQFAHVRGHVVVERPWLHGNGNALETGGGVLTAEQHHQPTLGQPFDRIIDRIKTIDFRIIEHPLPTVRIIKMPDAIQPFVGGISAIDHPLL